MNKLGYICAGGYDKREASRIETASKLAPTGHSSREVSGVEYALVHSGTQALGEFTSWMMIIGWKGIGKRVTDGLKQDSRKERNHVVREYGYLA